MKGIFTKRWILFVVMGGAVGVAPLIFLTCWLLVFFPLLHVGRVVAVPNQAMSPGVRRGDCIYMDEMSYRKAAPRRGDIVCFRGEGLPTLVRQDQWQIKRVVGLPGDVVSIRNGALYVGEKPADEVSPYHYRTFQFDRFLTQEESSFTVPKGTYFVLGDNPDGSYDSRFFGPVPMDNIRGQAIFGLWPLTRIGRLK